MSSSKKYYKDIDFIRLLACIAVLLYHLNILKGGYLAVCLFFVLSGYLSCISAFRKENFSLISYYSNRLLKIYLPLLIIVFITIAVVSLFPNINWLNLKPETTSVLLGYNNFWQIGANLDYFARHIDSPFIHLWYIAILLQFDLIFPFIYIPLRKIGDKFNKIIPCVITFLLSIIFALYFYKISITENIMVTYYNTFTRIFSLFFGLMLGFIHSYYGALIPSKLKENCIHKILFYVYILILILLFIFVDAKSVYFQISMIITTLISCRLIDYGTIIIKDNLNIYDKFIKGLSVISYEIYLFQYPVIFLFQYINIYNDLKMPVMIIMILILSFVVHFAINFNKKNKILKCIMCIIILGVSQYGIFQYFCAEDHTKEMKALEEQLQNNQQIIQNKQKEYELQLKQEEDDWASTLIDLENAEKQLSNIVTNLPIVGIGDSVMLGAVTNLYKKFPNGYFDAQISRTAWVASGILQNLKNRNILGDPVIINLGSNGDCPLECKKEIMKICGDREVFWVNVTNDNDVGVNKELVSLASKYNNLHIIDWYSVSKGHPEYFIADKIHLTDKGREVYANTIYDAIYKIYLEEYNEKKEEILKEHEEKTNSKISFYGNDLLLNCFDYLQTDFYKSKFIVNKEFNYETLKIEIEKSINDKSLTHRIVFAFDNTINLSLLEYQDLINMCNGHEIYILTTNDKYNIITYENVTIIDFNHEIKNNSEYLMADKVHLTDKGNKALSELLKRVLINKNEI